MNVSVESTERRRLLSEYDLIRLALSIGRFVLDVVKLIMTIRKNDKKK